MLESELKAESEHIRTIIKARGISYPNVTGKTFAVFRVDKQHHLMSLVSMIGKERRIVLCDFKRLKLTTVCLGSFF